ncbi:probable inactive purple acid phosphatase 29 [Tanacetum coccineum]
MARSLFMVLILLCSLSSRIECSSNAGGTKQLRFDRKKGEFKILHVADMHYADAEKPDLIVFTRGNIFGFDAIDAVASMNAAFAPSVASGIPWVTVLGNHDQESPLSRKGVMKYIVGMKHALSQFNHSGFDAIDGFGNYNLEVHGVEGSSFMNKSILNLYFLDSGDYSKGFL